MWEETKIVRILDKIVIFSIYPVVFYLPISKAIIEIASTLAIICYLVKKLIQRGELLKNNINYAIFAYLAICFISVFTSSNFGTSSKTFAGKIIQDTLFFFVVADSLNSQRRIKIFLFVLFFSSLILGVDGIYQNFTHKDFIRHRPHYGLQRIHTTFPTPNDFGCYLVTVIPFVLICSFLKSFRKPLRISLLCLSVLLFICLLLTVSRGAWFAFVSTMLFMSIWVRPLGIIFLLLGLFIMVTQQFYYPVLKERLSNFFIFGDSSSMDRKMIWQAGWKMFMSKPWIGLGIGTFMFNFKKFVVDSYPFGIPYAHNCYLQMAAEIGIIGLSAFFLILIIFFYGGIKIIITKQRTFSWYILLAAIAAIVGYCVQMTVDTNFYSLDLGLLFWMILGVGVAAMKLASVETNPQNLLTNPLI